MESMFTEWRDRARVQATAQAARRADGGDAAADRRSDGRAPPYGWPDDGDDHGDREESRRAAADRLPPLPRRDGAVACLLRARLRRGPAPRTGGMDWHRGPRVA